jgi:hypothetical protein
LVQSFANVRGRMDRTQGNCATVLGFLRKCTRFHAGSSMALESIELSQASRMK